MGQTAVSDNQSSSLSNTVTEMLNALNWQTLQHRRIQNSLIIIMLYKIKYYLVAVLFSHGNLAYVMIMLFINIKLLMIDNYLSKGFPGQLHETLCKCIGMIFG